MAFINFINITGGGGGDASAVTQDFTSTIERTVSSLTLPSGTTTIGQNAFASCSALTEVTIPAGVQTIEANAFAENRSLQTINFEGTTPPQVASDAFSQLPSDVVINVPEGSEDAYSAITEEIEDSTAFIIEYTDFSGNTIVWYSKNSGVTYNDPANAQPERPQDGWAKIEIKSVKYIESNGFLNEDAVEYVFDDAVSWVGCTPIRGNVYTNIPTKITYKSTSFDYFDARIVEMATNVSSITFYRTTAPSIIDDGYINSSHTANYGELFIPEGAKDYGAWKNFYCGEDWVVKDLSGNTMNAKIEYTYENDAGWVVSGDNYYLNSIPDSGFSYNTELRTVNIKSGTIGNYAFRSCSGLTSVTIASGVTNMGHHVFYSCSNLTSVTIEGGAMTEIGGNSFEHSGLQSIVIPEGITTIQRNAFASCSALTSVTLPSTLTKVNAQSFTNDSALASITCYSTTAPKLAAVGIFSGLPSGGTLNIPSGSTASYSAWTAQLGSGWTVNEMGGGGSTATFDLVNNCANYGSGKTDILDFYIPLDSSATPSLDIYFGSAVGGDGLGTEIRKGNDGITIDYVPNQDDALKRGEFIYDITQHHFMYSDSSVYESYPDADADADLQTLGLFAWQEEEINGETYLLISINSGESYASMADLEEWGLWNEEVGFSVEVVDANNDIYTYYE